ncbi:MAG: hypothetical protein OEY36_04165 [Gammaproteobacteria bacterium]|nr:hypothetical protein [Gammaproteobacteria bacterium]
MTNQIRLQAGQTLKAGTKVGPAVPLHEIVPSRDENGKPLSDFMMIIPKLKYQSDDYIQQTLNQLEKVLNYYKDKIVFVDLNMKMNLLWVTIRPIPGLIIEISAAIKTQVPEALLVADHQAEA